MYQCLLSYIFTKFASFLGENEHPKEKEGYWPSKAWILRWLVNKAWPATKGVSYRDAVCNF